MHVRCDYCGSPAVLTTGQEVYPHLPHLWPNPIYRCRPCDAHVGCHPGTTKALGRLANKDLRGAKMAAHAAFDPHWKGKRMSRSDAYGRLAVAMGIPARDCHIGMFDVNQCERVVEICGGW